MQLSLPGPDTLPDTSKSLMARITSTFNDEERRFYVGEFRFFNLITLVSAKLMAVEPHNRKEAIARLLEEVEVRGTLYLPTNISAGCGCAAPPPHSSRALHRCLCPP